MPNKFYNDLPSKGGGKAEGGTQGGKAQSNTMAMKTASWPGLPGKPQPGSRANGMPTTGHCGPFNHKKEGL